MLKKILYIIIQCTWGIGQTLIGFFIFLSLRKCEHKSYRCAIDTRWNGAGGLSMGLFIFTPKEDVYNSQPIRVHEYGHTIQSLVLGPLYALVGIISVGWGSVVFPILRSTEKYKDIPYTKCFVEYNASWLGEKVTGEKAVW